MAAIGDGQAFESGRDVAAWLGLVPRENSTGRSSDWNASASAATGTSAHCWCIAPRRALEALSKHTDRPLGNLSATMAISGRSNYEDRDARTRSWPGIFGFHSEVGYIGADHSPAS